MLRPRGRTSTAVTTCKGVGEREERGKEEERDPESLETAAAADGVDAFDEPVDLAADAVDGVGVDQEVEDRLQEDPLLHQRQSQQV